MKVRRPGAGFLVRRGFWARGRFFANLDRFFVAVGRVVPAFIGRQWFLVSVFVLGGLVLALWKVPQWQRNVAITNPVQVDEAEDRHRTTLAQIIGGAFFLGTLYFTWQGLQVAREGQITERFTRAIDQLGADHNDGKPKREVRLGGIYALEQIARHSETLYPSILDILRAYIRENARLREGEDGKPDYDSAEVVAADIQGVLTVLGRHPGTFGEPGYEKLHLSRTNLRGANLVEAVLQNADLGHANLQDAQLLSANLCGALLNDANLRNARLRDANLEGALLTKANLSRTFLMEANLQSAILSKTNLQEATFNMAHLRSAVLNGATLHGADLRCAIDLVQAQVDSAIGDENTRLPPSIRMPESWKN